jgi:excisionase family DNA binding protein
MTADTTIRYHEALENPEETYISAGQGHELGGPKVSPQPADQAFSRIREKGTGDASRAGLLLDDGSVVVPAVVAGEVLRALVRDVTARVRADGGEVSPACRALLSALYEASRRSASRVAVDGNDETAPATLDVTGMATVAQVAEVSGHSPRTLRHWAAHGRLTAVRVGRTWLIDPQSLRSGAHGTPDRYTRA